MLQTTSCSLHGATFAVVPRDRLPQRHSGAYVGPECAAEFGHNSGKRSRGREVVPETILTVAGRRRCTTRSLLLGPTSFFIAAPRFCKMGKRRIAR